MTWSTIDWSELSWISVVIALCVYYCFDRYCEMREAVAQPNLEALDALGQRIDSLIESTDELFNEHETTMSQIEANTKATLFEHGENLDLLKKRCNSLQLEIVNRMNKP
jgi:hypothetical protein